MNDLESRLQDALGDVYRLERELGGGGMSRLFLATERSLDRQVVVKLLPPDATSAVSAARFKQEMAFVARLRHPHILPILAAGSRDGLLYYVMPYVAGESLRHRLLREKELPLADAQRILTEVADALDFAHASGVVHRDVKPENILLEHGRAMLADFGVARAVSGSTMASGLTLPGYGVGTPSYMSPEQIDHSAELDGRADLYALAVVGYEMIAGRPPFTGATAQSVMAAHLRDTPRPLADLRPEVPSEVSDAIARALAKSPGQRFGTAAEFIAALGGGGTPSGAVRAVSRGPRRRRIGLVAAVAAVLVGGAAIAFTLRDTHGLDRHRVAVAPFEVLDPTLVVWHEGLVDVVSRNLDGAGSLRAAPPSVVLRRWSGRVDASSAVALGHATGARYAVIGSLLRVGADSVRLSATLLDAANGGAVLEFQRGGLASRMDLLSDALSIAVVDALAPGRGAARVSSIGSSSLPAIKAFLRGEQYYRRAEWDSALAAYGRAIAADSTFSVALMRMSDVETWAHDFSSQQAGVLAERALRGVGALAGRESLLVAGHALVDLIGRRTNSHDVARQALAIAGRATRRYPDDPEAWHLLAQARLFGGVGGDLDTPLSQVRDAELRAIELDSAYAPSYLDAINIALKTGQVDLARRLLKSLRSAAPSGPATDGMHVIALSLDPATAWTPAMRHILDTLSESGLGVAWGNATDLMDSSETAYRIVRPWAERADVVPTLKTLAGRLAATITASRGRVREADSLQRAWVARFYPRVTQPAVHFAEWCMLGVVPPDECREAAREMLRDPDFYRALGTQYLMTAAASDTVILKALVQRVDSIGRADTMRRANPVYRFTVDASRAFLLLARHDSAAALLAFEAISDTVGPFLFCRLTQARLLVARGRSREALALLNRRGSIAVMYENVAARPLIQLERGRTAERVGDRKQAIEAYGFVADAWLHADSVLQPFVAEAHAALRRLGAERENGVRLLAPQ